MYATPEQFAIQYQDAEVDELSKIDNVTDSPNSRLVLALEMGASEIDQILGNRFIIPIKTPVPYLTLANLVIARNMLSSYQASDKVRQDYEDVIRRLEGIAEGLYALVDISGNIIQPKPSLLDSADTKRGQTYSGNPKFPPIDFSGRIYRINTNY
jgi:phage gp36-like protein